MQEKTPPSLLDAFDKLVRVVHELREKCPWDRKQTLDSLRHLTIEETYELAEAILEQDPQEIQEELGDLLLHIVFYARISEEKGWFTLAQAIETQTEKLIRRHPHIYGEVKADTEEAVRQNWEQIKAEEKKKKAGESPSAQRSMLQGVPSTLPSLIQAYRIQEKVAQVGFDWKHADQVWEKVGEELQEFREATDPEEKEAEMGDLLFSLVNYCRWMGINPDDALARTNRKFKRRFEHMEASVAAEALSLRELSLEEMEARWQAAKEEEK